MKISARIQLVLFSAFLLGCGGQGSDRSREDVESALRDRLGQSADPKIAFIKDSTHLLVELATVAFPTVPERVLTGQARSIARLAFNKYEKASELDSVTVLYREIVRKGLWHIRHQRSFSVIELRTR